MNVVEREKIRKPGYCALCRSRCGTLNIVENGRLVDVEPDPNHPTGGAMCRKGRAAPEMVYNPRRLRQPLRRTTPKGAADPGWVPITWEAALDEIAERMRTVASQSGPEAVAFGVTTPAGTAMSDSIEWVERFVRTFGSPNICYATEICKWHQDFAHRFTFGVGIPTPDYKNTDLIVLWGYNPSRTWLSQASRISDAQRRGAKLVVVDPRRTGHAQQANHWLRVRPGSDGILALALAHQIIEGQHYDAEFVRRWSNGTFLVREDNGRFLRSGDLDAAATEPTQYVAWCERQQRPRLLSRASSAEDGETLALRGRFQVQTPQGTVTCRPAFEIYTEHCAQFPPERAQQLTWVDAEQIRRTAESIGAARRVSYYAWTGVGQSATATQTERAIALLYALTGSFDSPGGNVCFSKLPSNKVNDLTLLSAEQKRKALGYAQRPLGPPSQGWITAADLYQSVLDGLPYRVRLLFAFGGNMLLSQADPERGRRALEQCEFHVHCDLVETPTARFADILLPVSTPWEREALRVGFDVDGEGEELVQFRDRIVEPQFEARSDTWIVFELVKRLGLSAQFYGGEVEAGWEHMLKPLGLTLSMLRERPEGVRIPLQHRYRKYAEANGNDVRGFDTDTRRVEIYSEFLLRSQYEPVPTFASLAVELDAQDNGDTYPLILTSAKNGYFCHTEHRDIATLRKRSIDPTMEISPALARAQGLEEGDWAALETASGRARFKIKLNEDIDPRVVVGGYGWWQACRDLGLPEYDPFSENGSNLNRVIAARQIDPLSGSVPHRSFPCRLRRLPSDERRPWSGLIPFKVVELRKEATCAMSLTLAAVDGRRLPDFRPGQHALIELPATAAGGGNFVRSYSFSAGHSAARDVYQLTVKDANCPDADKSASAFINRTLRAGDTVKLSAPKGHFLLPVNADLPVVLLAAGVGITPFMSFLETIVERGSIDAPVRLYYGNRNSQSHLFQERLRILARSGLFQTTDYYSQPLPGDRIGTHFDVQGRLGPDCIDAEYLAGRARFYLCGPADMISALTRGLIDRGVPRFDIFSELFSSGSSAGAATGGPFNVSWARSGRTVRWTPAAGTLLECGEKSGLPLTNGCRVGQCESCSVKVISGSVIHLNRPDLDGEDFCLTCQAVPGTDLVLDA